MDLKDLVAKQYGEEIACTFRRAFRETSVFQPLSALLLLSEFVSGSDPPDTGASRRMKRFPSGAHREWVPQNAQNFAANDQKNLTDA